MENMNTDRVRAGDRETLWGEDNVVNNTIPKILSWFIKGLFLGAIINLQQKPAITINPRLKNYTLGDGVTG
jgi:hypothetical protein